MRVSRPPVSVAQHGVEMHSNSNRHTLLVYQSGKAWLVSIMPRTTRIQQMVCHASKQNADGMISLSRSYSSLTKTSRISGS